MYIQGFYFGAMLIASGVMARPTPGDQVVSGSEVTGTTCTDTSV